MNAELDFRRDIDPNSLYELTSLLGEGSYGAVYKAYPRYNYNNNINGRKKILNDHDELRNSIQMGLSNGNNSDANNYNYGEGVAIKIIPDADDDLGALWREIKFLQDLRSPFVVSFIESLLYDNELWLVMELCDVGSIYDLKTAMKTPFSEDQLQAIMAFSTLGLAHLHSQMSIHRDVKSGNILLTRDGKAKLGDFGISARLTDTIMKRRTVIGSPYWMAPEVIQETSYDGKADIWSLGITLLELCEGQPPLFNIHPMRAIFIISSRPAPTLREPHSWSDQLVDFLDRCLVKDCEQRASAQELLRHPFVSARVREVGPQGRPLQALRDLASEHSGEIERMRSQKFSSMEELVIDSNSNNNNNNNNSNNDNILTIRSQNGLPATRQQVRNLTLSRSNTPTARRRSVSGPPAVEVSDNKDDNNNNNKLFSQSVSYKSSPINDFKLPHDSNYESNNNNSYSNNNGLTPAELSSSIIRTTPIDSGSMILSDNKNNSRDELEAALKYFKIDSGNNSKESTPNIDNNSYNNNHSDHNSNNNNLDIIKLNRDKLNNDLIQEEVKQEKILNKNKRREVEDDSKHNNNNNNNNNDNIDKKKEDRIEQKQNIFFKKEIMKQLSTLKKQYREDLEELTRSYEMKRKLLKDTLAKINNDIINEETDNQINDNIRSNDPYSDL